MLVTFGTFWGGEGIGVVWPAGDAMLLLLLAGYTAAGFVGTWIVRNALISSASLTAGTAKA